MKSRRRLIKTEQHRLARKQKRKMIHKGVYHDDVTGYRIVPHVDMSWLPMVGALMSSTRRKNGNSV